jgi:hypothetical protein
MYIFSFLFSYPNAQCENEESADLIVNEMNGFYVKPNVKLTVKRAKSNKRGIRP